MAKNNKGWFLLSAFLGLVSAIPPLATDMYLPALPMLQQEFGISTSLVQLTMTMTLAGMAVGQVFAGPISDMAGRRKPLAIGMGIFSLASIGCYLVNDIWIFLLLRLIQGLSGSVGIVISKAIARDVSRGEDLTKFLAMLMMIHGLAPILAPVLGGQVLNYTSWRGVFVVLTIIGLIMVTSTLISQETLPKGRRLHGIGESLHVLPSLLNDRYFVGHCMIQSFVSAGFFSYIGSSSFVFQNMYNTTPQEFSYIFGSVGFGLMVAGTIPAKLVGRVSSVDLLKYALTVPLFGSAALFAALYAHAPLWLVILCLLLSVTPLSVMGATSFSLAMDKQGRRAGSASALLGFFSMFLGGMMMPVCGMLGDNPALPMAIFLFSGWLIGRICFQIFVKPEHS